MTRGLCVTILVGALIWLLTLGLIVYPCYTEHRQRGFQPWSSLVACG